MFWYWPFWLCTGAGYPCCDPCFEKPSGASLRHRYRDQPIGGAPAKPCTANPRFDWTGRSWRRHLGRWRRGQWRAVVATINRYGLWCCISNDVRPSHISGCGNWIWFGADRGFNRHHRSSGPSRIQRIYTGQENGR